MAKTKSSGQSRPATRITRSTAQSESRKNANLHQTIARNCTIVGGIETKSISKQRNAVSKFKSNGQSHPVTRITRSTAKSEHRSNANLHQTVVDGFGTKSIATQCEAVDRSRSSEQICSATRFTPSTSKSKQHSNPNLHQTIALNAFSIGEIVWCKLKGFCHSPAIVDSFEKEKLVVVWFNDYRRSTVFKSQLFKFSKNCEKFSKNKSVGFQTAIREAFVVLGKKGCH